MSLYYPIAQPTIAANVLVRRERRLLVPGEVLVRAGQRVEPTDVVAQGTITPEPVRVDIAADLALSPAATAKRLTVSPNQQVEQGAILAQRGGFGSRASHAPVGGTFSGYDAATGFGLISMPAETAGIQAHLKGIVTDLIPYYGAIIETPATLIRGIFGLGGEQHGVLKVIATGGEERVTAEMVDARVAYSIVLGGADVTAQAMRRMIELGARGVITGSIGAGELADFLGYPPGGAADSGAGPVSPGSHRLVPSMASWRLGVSNLGGNGWDFPPVSLGKLSPVPPDFVVVVTEGFGMAPMTARTFEVLAAHDGQEIAIDGSTRLRGGLARPEIIIPLARTTAVKWLDESGPKLNVGTTVRLLSPDYLGQTGQVANIPVGPRAAQSGAVAAVADVQMSGGRRLRVPVVDLEVLE